MAQVPEIRAFYGSLWLQSAKQARKSGFHQTAYIAVLHAERYEPPGLSIERAKLYHAQGQLHRGIEELRTAVFANGIINAPTNETISGATNPASAGANPITAKAALLMGRWMEEFGIGRPAQIEAIYKKATAEMPRWEKAWFYFGQYFNKQFDEQSERYRKILSESENIDKRFYEKEKLDWYDGSC